MLKLTVAGGRWYISHGGVIKGNLKGYVYKKDAIAAKARLEREGRA